MIGRQSGSLVLAAMILAVGLSFIDMTVVSIAVPDLQKDLHLSETGVQWVINGYMLALSASFALGGRIGDTFGKRKVVTVGIIVFTAASALCGATPTGSAAEPWIISFRVIQGFGAALMIPAALALVVAAFPIDRRGRALAIFFGVTGALTAVGPLIGGYLTEIDWRAIFWINVPVAIGALALTAIARPPNESAPAPIDFGGAALIIGGMGFSVLGLQQAGQWGWGSALTIGSIVVGALLITAFVAHELKASDPLIRVRIFADKAFAADSVVLALLMVVFIPLLFCASTYAQMALGQSSSEAGFFILYFFIGFAVAAQLGGRMLDKVGARPSIALGGLLGAIGLFLWASKMPDLSVSAQLPFIILTGFGFGLILGPANTDAINRSPASTYGEVTGITQTVRSYGATLGLAVLGTILITQNHANVEANLTKAGLPQAQADQIAAQIASGTPPPGGGAHAAEIVNAIETSYAQSTQTVFYIMAAVISVLFLFALIFGPSGKVETVVEEGSFDAPPTQSQS